jgi:hypothetical protein
VSSDLRIGSFGESLVRTKESSDTNKNTELYLGIVEHTVLTGLKCRNGVTHTIIILEIPTSATELHVGANRPWIAL